MTENAQLSAGNLFILFELLSIATCYPTSNTYIRKWILAPSMIAIAWLVWTQSPPLSDAAAYAIGSTMSFQLCGMTHLVYVQSGFPNFWKRVKDGEESPTSFSLIRKIGWMLDLSLGVRKVGWVQEARGALPPRPKFDSRAAFVVSRIAYAALHFLIVDLAATFMAGNPAFDTRVHVPTDGAETYLRAQPLSLQVLNIVIWGFVQVCSLTAIFDVVAALSVGLNQSKPEDWPSMFGNFKHAYTVRAFWGKSWHQMMRPMLSAIGKHVANKTFGFTPGTNLSSYTQLYTAFFVSGLIHLGADYTVMRHLTIFSPRFFLLQAVAITLEDFIQWCTKSVRSKIGWMSKAVGYLWVIVWFTWSGPLWVDYMSKNGQSSQDAGAVFGKLLEGWRTWA